MKPIDQPDPRLAGLASRRRVLFGLSSALAIGIRRPFRAVAHLCRMAVDADEGPFYPVVPIPETDDLAVAPGSTQRAAGQLMYLAGVVTGAGCRPLADATVEIWQCDSGGQYHHPRAPLAKDLDPSFRYFGKARTAGDGFYRFRTIRPSAYKVFGIERAPHIHIRVKHPGHPALTTEAYFAGPRDDALRLQDRVFQSRGARRAEMVAALEPAPGQAAFLRTTPETDALCLRFDLAFAT